MAGDRQLCPRGDQGRIGSEPRCRPYIPVCVMSRLREADNKSRIRDDGFKSAEVAAEGFQSGSGLTSDELLFSILVGHRLLPTSDMTGCGTLSDFIVVV